MSSQENETYGLFSLGDPLGRAVRAVGCPEGVVDEQVSVRCQLLPNKDSSSCVQREVGNKCGRGVGGGHGKLGASHHAIIIMYDIRVHQSRDLGVA